MLYMKGDGEISEFDGSEVLIFPLTYEELKFLKEDTFGLSQYLNLQYDGIDTKNENYQKLLENQLKDIKKDEKNYVFCTSWLIVSLLNKNIVGQIGLFDYSKNLSEISVFFAIGEHYQNQGYATISVELLCKFLKENKVKTLKAKCEKTNIIAKKVLEKTNFEKVYEDKDYSYFERKIQ